jgi:hypothetical protein
MQDPVTKAEPIGKQQTSTAKWPNKRTWITWLKFIAKSPCGMSSWQRTC